MSQILKFRKNGWTEQNVRRILRDISQETKETCLRLELCNSQRPELRHSVKITQLRDLTSFNVRMETDSFQLNF